MSQMPLMQACISVDNHGSKLQTLKMATAKPDALLLEKSRAWGNDFDCQGNEATKWKQYGRSNKNAGDVQGSLPSRNATRVGGDPRVVIPLLRNKFPCNSQLQYFRIRLKALRHETPLLN